MLEETDKMRKGSLYIVIPAYNEEETIGQVVCDWHNIVAQTGEESKLVVIDDGSRDNTYAILKQLQRYYPLLVVLIKENSGHGSSCICGYRYAIKNGAEYIFQTDSDGQTVSSEFWEFWEQRDNYDMLIGWRKRRQDGFSRIIVTKVLKVVIRVFFKVNVADANTPFRLMKAKTLKKCMCLVPKGYNLPNVLLSVIYAKKGFAVKYIPITFRDRQGGVNSINLKRITQIGKDAIRDFIWLNKVIENKEV